MRRAVLPFIILTQFLIVIASASLVSAQSWYEPPKKRLTIGGSLVDALADFQRHGGQVDEILTPEDLAGKPPLTYGIQNGRSVFALTGGRDGGLAGLVTVDGSSIQASMTPDGFLKLAPDQTGVRNRNLDIYRALFPDQDLTEYTTEAIFEYIDESGKRLLFGGSEDGKTTAFLFKKDPTTGELVYKVERDIAKAKEAKAGWVAPDESATFPVRFKICDENRDNCVVRNIVKKPGDEIRIDPHTQAIKLTFNKDLLPYHRKYGNAQRLDWACEYKGEGFYFTYREGYMGGDAHRLPNRIGELTCDKNELCCNRSGPGQKCNFDVRDYLNDPPTMMLFALNWLTSRLDKHKQHFTLTLDPTVKDHLRVTKFENLGCIKTAPPLYSRGSRGNDVPDRIYQTLKSSLCPGVGGQCSGDPAFTALEVTGEGEGTTLIDERTGVKLNNVTMAKVFVLRNDYGTGKRGDFVGAVVDNRAGGAVISTLLNMEDQPRAPDLLDKKEHIQPDNVEAILAEMKKEEEAEEIQREVLASRQRALVLFPARHGWGFASQPKDAKPVAQGRRPAHVVLLPPSAEPAARFAAAQPPSGQSPSSRYYTPSYRSEARSPAGSYGTNPYSASPTPVGPPPAYSRPPATPAYRPSQAYAPTPRAQSPQYPSYQPTYGSSPTGASSSYSSYGSTPAQGATRGTQAYGARPPYSVQTPSAPPPGAYSAPRQPAAPPAQYGSSDSRYYRTAASEVTPPRAPERSRYASAQPRIPLRLPIQEEAIRPVEATVRPVALSPAEEAPAVQPAEPRQAEAVPEPMEVVRALEAEPMVEAQDEEPEPAAQEQPAEPEPAHTRPVLVTPSLVREVQHRLKRQGYRISGVDGRLGPETTRAIRRFQRDVSLQPTGRISRPLLTSLGIEAENGWHTRRSTGPKTSSTYDNRRWKPTRSQVKEVQRRLALIGLEPGPSDGIMGSQTIKAVRQFQLQTGLRPTGHIDQEVLRRLSIIQ